MARLSTLLRVAILSAAVTSAAPSASAQSPATARVRVGTYDNRAVAVAYAASSFNPVKEKMAEHEAAKQAGDKAAMKRLETWGKNHQRLLHFQGFGRVPVADLLKPVRDGVAEIATREKLAVIAMECDFAAADVEVIDVTDQLVELFSPTDRTRKMAESVRTHEPASLIELADMPADE